MPRQLTDVDYDGLEDEIVLIWGKSRIWNSKGEPVGVRGNEETEWQVELPCNEGKKTVLRERQDQKQPVE